MLSRRFVRAALATALLSRLAGPALAHGGGISGARPDRLAVPTWLFLLTGGGVIAASFLLASFLTDRRFVSYLHGWSRPLLSRVGGFRRLGQLLGLVGLAVVLLSGAFGPTTPVQSAAILLVWAGWWAGYTITVYTVGDSWPAVNPFRTLAAGFRGGRVDYPARFGTWPAVVGLLALIWLEVVSPLAADPRFLAGITAVYTVVTLAGAYAVGSETWFRHADPIACVFRQYGKVAPVQVEDGSVRLVLPGARLASEPAATLSEVGLIVALVWGTTYDGLVGTPLWRDVATAVVGAGVPAPVFYPFVLGAGYLVFLKAFHAASRSVRGIAPTYLTETAIARAFAPSLLAIAASYHLAHYLEYFLALAPALVGALATPLSHSAGTTLSLPEWFGGLPIAFVLLGHLLAVWVAHGVAYERFPSRLQAIRSQYPITAVMVLYTMVSLWIVTQPYVAPPYV